MPPIILWIMLGLAFGTGVGVTLATEKVVEDVRTSHDKSQ